MQTVKNIRTKSKRRWVTFKQAIREFFFKLFAVRKITKTISKTYYNLVYRTGKELDSIFMVPAEFKKYSNEQIEHALDILVKYKKLSSWCKKIQHNEDGYLLVLTTENCSQSRFYNNIPEEIDLNQVKVETSTPQSLEQINNQPIEPTTIEEPTEDDYYDFEDDGKPF